MGREIYTSWERERECDTAGEQRKWKTREGLEKGQDEKAKEGEREPGRVHVFC